MSLNINQHEELSKSQSIAPQSINLSPRAQNEDKNHFQLLTTKKDERDTRELSDQLSTAGKSIVKNINKNHDFPQILNKTPKYDKAAQKQGTVSPQSNEFELEENETSHVRKKIDSYNLLFFISVNYKLSKNFLTQTS